jgi:ATP-dependent RNA helicase DDX10/DBP4
MAYMRSIFLMKNKNLFKMDSIDVAKFSQSLGLIIAPRIRFMQQKTQKPKEETSESDQSDEDQSDEKEMSKKEKKAKNKKKLLELKRIAKEKDNLDFNPFGEKRDGEDDDTLFTVKRVFNATTSLNIHESGSEDEINRKSKIKLKSKASIVKQIKKKKINVNEKIIFDDDGNVRVFDFRDITHR